MSEDVQEELSDDVWSITKLQAIQACGNKYRIRYEEHIKDETTVPLSFGGIIHEYIENIHLGHFEGIGEIQESWVDDWGPISRRLDWTGELMSPLQYKNRGLKMLEKYWANHCDDIVICNELKFDDLTLFPGIKVRGKIDKIQQLTPDTLGIVDFKTSKNPPDPLLLRRDLQLTMYYAAAKRLGYNINYLAIHHLLSGDVYWTWRDDDDLIYLEEALSEAKRKVDNRMFARNIDFGCKFCSYKVICLG